MAPLDDLSLFRVYDHAGKDGYPPKWHRLPGETFGIKDLVREASGHRCVRCGHPYRNGQHGSGEWTPCDSFCFANDRHPFGDPHTRTRFEYDGESGDGVEVVEAHWRILTVHHLNGDKRDCRWWNLLPLCQRDHLSVQGRVNPHQVWPWLHSEWFKLYAAGFYAWTYLNENLTRTQTLARVDELLALELTAG